MPCGCGAEDCPSCYPQNFTRIEGQRIFTAEMTEDEVDQVRADAADARISYEEERQDRLYDEGRYR